MSPRFAALLIGWILGCGAVCHAQKPEARPAPAPTPNPQEKREEAIIVLERTTDYFGVTPAYLLIIYPDGSVAFIGDKNVKTKGLAMGRISQQDLRRLIEEFDKINYFSLRDRYEKPEDGCEMVVEDAGSAYVWYRLGDRRKSVHHHLGCSKVPSKHSGFETIPRELYNLEYLIDAVVNSNQWVK